MPMESLFVKCPDDVEVLADDDPVGPTNHTLKLSTGVYSITLEGPATYQPSPQQVVLVGTSSNAPKVIEFTRVSAPAKAIPVAGRAPRPAGAMPPVTKRAPTAPKPAAKKASRKKVPAKKPVAPKKVAKKVSKKQVAKRVAKKVAKKGVRP